MTSERADGWEAPTLAKLAYEDRPPLGKRPVPWTPVLRREWTAWAERILPRLAAARGEPHGVAVFGDYGVTCSCTAVLDWPLGWSRNETAAGRLVVKHAARGEPPEPGPAIDGDTLRAALEAMWPHHTEGIGSSPPSPGDHTYEVWEPFLPGSPDSVATALVAALRDKP